MNDDVLIFDRIKRMLEFNGYIVKNFDIDTCWISFNDFDIKIINNKVKIINFNLEESEKLKLMNGLMKLYDNISIERG